MLTVSFYIYCRNSLTLNKYQNTNHRNVSSYLLRYRLCKYLFSLLFLFWDKDKQILNFTFQGGTELAQYKGVQPGNVIFTIPVHLPPVHRRFQRHFVSVQSFFLYKLCQPDFQMTVIFFHLVASCRRMIPFFPCIFILYLL